VVQHNQPRRTPEKLETNPALDALSVSSERVVDNDKMTLAGSEQLLGSGEPGDTHDTLIVAPSGCGRTELLKRLLLKF
jgi:hypothetical protein